VPGDELPDDETPAAMPMPGMAKKAIVDDEDVSRYLL